VSKLSRPRDVQPVLSILSSRWDRIWPCIRGDIEEIFGSIEYISEEIPFVETSYYDRELGVPIYRRVFSFESLVPPDSLVELKIKTNALEEEFSDAQGRRLFNLDPGILSLERFVLATGKEYTHRIYLGRGVWADLTLIFQKGNWVSLPWTYPDYGGKRLKEILFSIRERYKEKLRKLR